MNENKMSALVQKLVDVLRNEIHDGNELIPYISVFGDEYGVVVDWRIDPKFDMPESIRIMCFSDGEWGYIGCIRFDVNSMGDKDPNSVNFVFDEAEYDLEGVEGRVTLLMDVLRDCFNIE